MPALKGTRTEENLLKAFAGESQARNRYTYFAEQAVNEGLGRIGEVFLETAENELEHARVFFSFLEGGMVEITASYPAGTIATTAANLAAAAAGEHEEWSELYAGFAQVAESEGFKDVARAFKMVAKVEIEHEKRYRSLLEIVEKNQVYAKPESVRWKCTVCGYVHEGAKAPARCPVCDAGREEFEVAAENW
ncbi:MAG TPA: rubrerythrin family protein [Candidatus Krumholzibacteria bacterium]|nr:rubrerythrin family protein [Candidatus Krumholzibacteria bacterium]HPD71427.1 rubrerythrin family protein [Candidatus Krumholzibacteria bacterium]HRY41640.1 rubrerythrin family protein [Candidatus Krumholzibacteria bacterium]